ncbi:MAG: DEAD/DEAH box helicase [Asgard group archaeon]|nr:DEAD/DEAH box helicase [Asgard group archaeon]
MEAYDTNLNFEKKLNYILGLQQIKILTDIQQKTLPYISKEENLVIISPSGTGKTLIAELIALQGVFFNKKILCWYL